MCTLVLDNDYPQAIPYPATTLKPEFDFPTDCHPLLKPVLEEHGAIFCKSLGRTSVTQHAKQKQPVAVKKGAAK